MGNGLWLLKYLLGEKCFVDLKIVSIYFKGLLYSFKVKVLRSQQQEKCKDYFWCLTTDMVFYLKPIHINNSDNYNCRALSWKLHR